MEKTENFEKLLAEMIETTSHPVSQEDYIYLVDGIKTNMKQRMVKIDIIMKMINHIKMTLKKYTTINERFKDNVIQKLHDKNKNVYGTSKRIIEGKKKLDELDVKRQESNKKIKKEKRIRKLEGKQDRKKKG